MEDIKKWLDSDTPNFTEGVALFVKHSKNQSLIHLLQRKGEVKMSKLRYELEKIAGISPLAQKPKPKEAKIPRLKAERLKIDVAGKIKFEDLPEVLQPIYTKIVEDYKVMRSTHAVMSVSPSILKRAKCRKELDALDDAIAKGWETIDKWKDTGELPGEVKEPRQKEPGEHLTPQEVNAYRTYISRNLEKDSLSEEAHQRTQERITALLADGQNFEEATLKKAEEHGFDITQKQVLPA